MDLPPEPESVNSQTDAPLASMPALSQSTIQLPTVKQRQPLFPSPSNPKPLATRSPAIGSCHRPVRDLGQFVGRYLYRLGKPATLRTPQHPDQPVPTTCRTKVACLPAQSRCLKRFLSHIPTSLRPQKTSPAPQNLSTRANNSTEDRNLHLFK